MPSIPFYGNNILLYYALTALSAAIVVTIHEFSKALISSKLGDPLPKRDRRLTLNPLSHIEPIGFVMLVVWGFGWGKPVDTAPIYYPDRQRGTLLTYSIPSVINLFTGLIANVIAPFAAHTLLIMFLQIFCFMSLRQAIFNIIPIYPLDGAKILPLLSKNPNSSLTLANNEKILQMVLLFLIFFGIVGSIINPVCSFLIRLTS